LIQQEQNSEVELAKKMSQKGTFFYFFNYFIAPVFFLIVYCCILCVVYSFVLLFLTLGLILCFELNEKQML